MRLTPRFFPLALFGVAAACGSVPIETVPAPEGIAFPPVGVLRGTVSYTGPHPCSKNGHVVGVAALLVFDRRLLPPPSGLGSTPLNFAVITGDTLFANEPRNPGAEMYCPQDHGIKDIITASAPFVISPLPAGSFVIQSFYDYTGNFLPTFKFRNLPEKGDVVGGDIDTLDALNPINAGNPNYLPHFIPIDIGIPQPLPALPDAGSDGGSEGGSDGGANGVAPNLIPNFTLPSIGFVADNLTVTIGQVLQTTRPYFYPGGMATSFDPGSGSLTQTEVQTSALPPTSLNNIQSTKEKNLNFDPVLTIPQDIEVFAGPQAMTQADVNNFESKFPRLILHPGLPGMIEPPKAIAPPFNFQLPPAKTPSTFSVWQSALFDPIQKKWVSEDAAGQPIPQLWPLVILTKLVDDPSHTLDPASIKTQGSPTAPVVVIQGITLLGGDGEDATKPDSIYNTAQADAFGSLFDPAAGRPVIFQQDHLTVFLQPAVICFNSLFDNTNPDKRGTIVTPHLTATTADVSQPATPGVSTLPPAVLASPQVASLVGGTPIEACLPTGRYAINMVYPDGQAWTVPNETGACSSDEGATDYRHLTCPTKPRPILYSQGTRAVVEVVATTNPAHCKGAAKVPAICLPTAPQ
jgi:hypothetical protein